MGVDGREGFGLEHTRERRRKDIDKVSSEVMPPSFAREKLTLGSAGSSDDADGRSRSRIPVSSVRIAYYKGDEDCNHLR
jgi:hypothetical protein